MRPRTHTIGLITAVALAACLPAHSQPVDDRVNLAPNPPEFPPYRPAEGPDLGWMKAQKQEAEREPRNRKERREARRRMRR